jgi:hypothetical protein
MFSNFTKVPHFYCQANESILAVRVKETLREQKMNYQKFIILIDMTLI